MEDDPFGGALLAQDPQHVVVRLAVVDDQGLAVPLGDLDVARGTSAPGRPCPRARYGSSPGRSRRRRGPAAARPARRSRRARHPGRRHRRAPAPPAATSRPGRRVRCGALRWGAARRWRARPRGRRRSRRPTANRPGRSRPGRRWSPRRRRPWRAPPRRVPSCMSRWVCESATATRSGSGSGGGVFLSCGAMAAILRGTAARTSLAVVLEGVQQVGEVPVVASGVLLGGTARAVRPEGRFALLPAAGGGADACSRSRRRPSRPGRSA